MTAAIATTTTDSAPNLALVPHGMEEAADMAARLAKSNMLPAHFKGRVDDVFWAIAYGLELGLPPIAALRAVYVVHGRPGLYSDAMVAVVLAKGVAEYFRCVESTPERATYETKRRGAPEPVRKTFTMEQAKTAGLLTNDTYTKHPTRMLEARAKSFLARDVYPDVLHGMYSVEELQDMPIDLQEVAPNVFAAPPPAAAPPSTGDIIARRDLKPAKTAEDELAAEAMQIAKQVTEATTAEALEALLPALTGIKKKLGKDAGAVKQLAALYKAQKDLVAKHGVVDEATATAGAA